MEKNGLHRHSTPEKVTSVVIIIALLIAPTKWIYYDTGKLNALEYIYPVLIIGIIIALGIFKDFRERLFETWLRLMVYAPIFIIIIIIIAIVVYFFQVIFEAGPLDNSGE